MKKLAAVFALLFMAFTILFGIMGMHRIRSVYDNEIYTVQNLAGKVITAYPETENAFLEALGDKEKSDAKRGGEILAHYGYDENEKIKENLSYRREVEKIFLLLAICYIVSVAVICIFLHVYAVRRKKQEEQILTVLESALSGDYGFTENSGELEAYDNPLFADTLIKLGKALKVKTQWLEEEHDNTKTLVTDISHQLRTPVSALKACFSIYEEAEDEAEREEFYERCRLQIDKLELFTAALINISYMETHLITLHPQEVLLIDILTESVNSVYHKAVKKQISIENISDMSKGAGAASDRPDESENIRRIEGIEDTILWLDKKWTVEAVVNVLDNAVKYSPAGSRILIRMYKLANYIRIEVEDNGPGIKPDERNRVFRRFYRGDNDIVRKEEGTGVGLYLSSKILTDQGGSVFVRPAGDKGSIFIIQLPLFKK